MAGQVTGKVIGITQPAAGCLVATGIPLSSRNKDMLIFVNELRISTHDHLINLEISDG
jgi:hypothetical protein